jgi:NitT/TauT family transport system permease protein
MPSGRWAQPAFSAAAFLALWTGAAILLQSRYFPSPADVWLAFYSELQSGALLHHLSATFMRVAASFAVAMLAGTAIGLYLGRKPGANRFFDPWLIFALNVPAIVTIIFCYLWIGLTEAAAIVAVALNKIPNVAITLREGARALDTGLDEVARVYQLSPWVRFKSVTWPQLEPFMAAAVRSGLALIWKIVLVVELLGRSDGVGFQINLFFGLFDLARILAYSLSFMAIVWLIETSLIKPWERRARHWRREKPAWT